MILTAQQPVYLPWIGLFHKIALADKFVFLDNVQFEKNSWQNRNKIRTSMGSMWLTVPVLQKGHLEKKTSAMKIHNELDWTKKHFKSIFLNYKKSPFFDTYIQFFEEVYTKKWLYLADLNEYMLKWFLKELVIDVEFLKASDFDFKGTKSDLVLDMCKQLNVDLYIFGTLGKDYANVDEFNKAGIKVVFQDYKHPIYRQLYGNFISHLSVIDLLFNYGPDSYKIIMSNNITKAKLSQVSTKN